MNRRHVMPMPDQTTTSRRSTLFGLMGLPFAATGGGCVAARAGEQAAHGHAPSGPLAAFARAPASPALASGTLLRTVALTSCSHQDRPQPLFDVIRAGRPDLLLMLGDNVYGSDTPDDPDLPGLRRAYAAQAASRPFRRLVRSVPTRAVWDDHDFGRNDGGGDFPHRALAQRMFATFWREPVSSALWRRPGIHRSLTVGPAQARVQVILLDTRSFRSPLLASDQRDLPGRERYRPHPVGADVTVLGADQWAWLERTLREPADIRLVCSSIQVIAEGHGWERWGNFPDERDRLYRLIAATGARGVVFLSGDRHHGSIHRTAGATPYPLVDLTASAINMPSGHAGPDGISSRETSTTRIGGGYTPVNFGRVAIDWRGRTLGLELIGAGGQPVQAVTVPFAALGHA